ncbi:hypothetical protein PFICI_04560 [Pestalotiopsis fici W106-1]|uniref:Major facilitator superfamily (MFS) profile domain-containing protein n=1 Tax=Pestalotiopsis fici (strain W106-1 / CGMCC3.15140) TaxID=1229662 RepID=W3X9H0_PESFW|nr:uncharacterized protein PFICI_04560 [Pestalotiopsis fici W106-1]ETS82684.1 hypothetical protein PFICI_04560 [Pestalotiopsis fici W106-1]
MDFEIEQHTFESPTQRRIAATDWNGPDDPDNPRNFPFRTRCVCISILTLLAFISAFAGAIYAPAVDEIMTIFNCSYEVAVLPLTLYNLGLSFGPIVGAPLSEQYGRRAVFVFTTPIFILFMVGASFSRTLQALIVCRFFAGMFASPNINNASATILDYTAERYRGTVLGIYYSIPSEAANLAPLIGGFVVRATNWRWTQWVAIVVAITIYVPTLFTPETYKRKILERRARKQGLEDAFSRRSSPGKAIRYFFLVLIQRPLHMLFTEPIVLFVSLYNGLIFGLIYAFVTSVPWIFETYYGFDGPAQSLSYLGLSIGTGIACLPFALIDIYYYQRRIDSYRLHHGASSRLPPKHRLVSSLIGSALIPIGLFVSGWAAERRVHWMVTITFQGVTMTGSLLVYAGASLFMLDSYGPLYGASASSSTMLSRYSLSTAFPMFALQMFQVLGAGWGTSLLAFLSLLMAPIPWCFWIWGESLRRRSKYEISQ